MVSLVARCESQQLVPQSSSFAGAQKNSNFSARRVISFAGGCPDAVSQERSSHGGSLQIVGGSFFDWNTRGACLAHEPSGRCVFGTSCSLRRRRTVREQRHTSYPGAQTNG